VHAFTSPGWAKDAPEVLLLLHGFGSNEQDLPALGPLLAPELPWASLRAPLTLPHGGYAWFPIMRPGNPAPASIAAATDAIWEWAEENLRPEAKIVGIGFSQGGLIATQLLRTRPERVAATVVLSGFVQAASQPADEQLASDRPVVFWGRGTEDRVITEAAVERTAQWLPAHSTLTERVYPGLSHGISNEEIADIRAFLGSRQTAQR
jgi:phospholipase/carboxylesterase